MFCDKCDELLKPVEGKMICNSCGTTTDGIIKEKKKKEVEVVVMNSEDSNTLPETNVDCDKCGHNKAYHWSVQTRSADEPETLFFKCSKCNHQWRQY